jgi:type II restriction/modification system DNA methylase subunit YeeA
VLLESYGLQAELSPSVSEDAITLSRPNREQDIKRLLSYAVGCMLGRFSLDRLGLIFAHRQTDGFDASQYKKLSADEDGIVTVSDVDWGMRNDATDRLVEFFATSWSDGRIGESLTFVAEAIGAKTSEQPKEVIRKYFAEGFFKNHLSVYRKRPIYWLFSSGKERAFQCVVYLHRYRPSTLARMRTEYVIPLQGQVAGRIEQIEAEKTKASSTSQRKKLQKEQDDLKKKQAELLVFEEKLKHFADKKISLDLDDGVKVNYGKFGDLLAEVKAITGGKDDE